MLSRVFKNRCLYFAQDIRLFEYNGGENTRVKRESIGSSPIAAAILKKFDITLNSVIINYRFYAEVAELVDASDLKSDGLTVMRVRVPLSAPI